MFGVMLAIAVSAGIPWAGLANLVSGLVFGFSFLAILVSGASLITSDMAAGFIALCQRKMKFRQYLGFITLGWIGNITGALLFIGIVASGPGNYGVEPFLSRAHAMAVSKVAESPMSVICMGIICTWLLQTGFVLYVKARTDVGKMIGAWYGPMAFVAGMTQHCIANIGIIGLPLLMQDLYKASPAPGQSTATTGNPMPMVSWGFGEFGMARNQILTFLGNFVGGTVFVAGLFLLIAKFSAANLSGVAALASNSPTPAISATPRRHARLQVENS